MRSRFSREIEFPDYSTEELVAMAKIAARHGGAYFTHQRSESGRIEESLDEAFRPHREEQRRAASVAA